MLEKILNFYHHILCNTKDGIGEALKIRCPSCEKLYVVNEEDIQSHSPQFDCVSCATRFGFVYPPENPQSVPTFKVTSSPEIEQARSFQQELEAQSFAALQQEISQAAEKNSTKSCAKCGAINEKKATECYSCHVLFERMDQLPLDPMLRAQPSLVRKWKNLVVNFDNLQLHEEFLKSCHQLEALRFAILKYEELQKAQGGRDEVCAKMIFKAQGLLQVTLSGKKEGDLRFQKEKEPSKVPRWHKYVILPPFAVAGTMIAMGFFNLGIRNLVGAGVAVALLTLGLVLFWKGRISLADFR